MNPKHNRARDIGFYVLLVLILIAVIFTMTKDTEPDTLDNYSELADLFNAGKVQSFRTEGNKIILTLRTDGTDKMTVEKTYDLYSFGVFYEDFNELIKEQHEKGILEKYDYNEGFVVPWWASIIPYLILMGGAMVLWYVMMNRMGGGAGGVARFSKARTRLGSDEKNKKTFADVAGCDEEKEELAEIVEFLKDPKAYTAMGARIPKGVLLVGPPGTGKTLLAKAVAGEAGVQFLSISGSDFVELYVGVGAGRVRDLFEQAKKAAPAIIFIDEIDAVGRQRGSGLGGGHDEREQTLNQLLDNALLRPGRFDRQVYVGLPDIRGREAILKIHSRDKQLGDDVDLNSIAKGTPGFAGADLENLMNEAALLAVRRKHRFITMEDVDEAILKVQMGPEKKSRKMSDKAKRLTAYHESGHAVAAKFCKHVDPVHYITIIPRGPAGGFTLFRPQEDLENFTSKEEMFENIVVSLGGRIAEKLFLDDISTGASGDIQQASSLARDMVMKYGMSERLGPILYDTSGHSIFIGRDFGQTKSYSEETAAIIDEEVKAIFDEAAKRCEEILTEHGEQLRGLAEYLLVNETIEADEFNYYFEHGEFMPEVLKAGKQARHDSTIERPAKKISMTDGYAEEQKTDTENHVEAAAAQDAASADEGSAETKAEETSAEAESTEENTASETDLNE